MFVISLIIEILYYVSIVFFIKFADQLNSLVSVLLDFEFFLCFFGKTKSVYQTENDSTTTVADQLRIPVQCGSYLYAAR